MPMQVPVQNEIGHSRTEYRLALLQRFHGRHQVISPVGLEDPPANTSFQTISDRLLRIHISEDQYPLIWIVFQDFPGHFDAI